MYFRPCGNQLSVLRDDHVIGSIYKGTDNIWTFFIYGPNNPERRALSAEDVNDLYRVMELLKS